MRPHVLCTLSLTPSICMNSSHVSSSSLYIPFSLCLSLLHILSLLLSPPRPFLFISLRLSPSLRLSVSFSYTSSLPTSITVISSSSLPLSCKTGKKPKDRKDDVTGFRANTWLPSERRSMNDQRAAVDERDRERAVRDGVLDGSRAPKLTGRNRYMKVRTDTFWCINVNLFSSLLIYFLETVSCLPCQVISHHPTRTYSRVSLPTVRTLMLDLIQQL